MIKKTLAAAGVAALLLLGGAASATASTYPPSVTADTVAPGASTTITFSGFGDAESVIFTSTGPSEATLSSIAFTATGLNPVSTTKDVSDGSASVTFAAQTPGEYTISNNITDATQVITVAAASTGGGTPGLPPTGSEVPTTALWLGIGAVGLGGIAVTAAVARRRAASNN